VTINILTLLQCHVFFRVIVLKGDSNAVAMTFQQPMVANTNRQYAIRILSFC